jgi:outer membrane protein TolC
VSRLGRADAARRRCGPTGFALVVASLLAGCSTTPGPASRLPLLPDLAQSALLAASSSTPAPAPPPAAEIVRVSHDAEGPADPGPTFTLADAVGFALANSPRLRMAQAAVERAGGQEEEAFAPFLPQVGLLNRYGGTNAPLSPGAPGLTGAILPTVNGAHTFLQSELQLQWTLYDFGRTGGRHRQAVARERMAELRLARALETVAYDTATAYLDALLAASVRIIREESIRRARAGPRGWPTGTTCCGLRCSCPRRARGWCWPRSPSTRRWPG